MAENINRRSLLRTGSQVVIGAVIGESLSGIEALAQFPPPTPLKDDRASVIYSTEANKWQPGQAYNPTFTFEMLNLNIEVDRQISGTKPIEGFGGAFSERGWAALSSLGEQDRGNVMRELFDPNAGTRFSYCRTPIGANDYALEAYSYDETDGDFNLMHFSIDRDMKTLVPFIRAAQHYQPKLKLWASPWTPPSWMKRNHFYAEAPGFVAFGQKPNGIRQDQIGHEGQDMFIQDPRYLEAYARYFGRYIDAYQEQGIRVGMVMPQNEFNSAQNFPSCTWTPEALAAFLRVLGPEMDKRKVDIFFGTLERGKPKLLEVVMADKAAASYVKGVGVQWAGKNALPRLSREFPGLTFFQSEQECGDGKNTWGYAAYGWELMKHYFRSGVSGYMYWNIATENGGESSWGWKQNSLVTVDGAEKTFQYTPDFYLIKHLTHYVDVGARAVEATGTFDDALAFVNPDGSVVALLRNEAAQSRLLQVSIGSRAVALELPPDSLGTLRFRPA